MKLVLSGVPKSTQHIYRYACRGKFGSYYMTAQGKALKQQYEWEARSQWTLPPLEGDLVVTVHLYFNTARRHDIDNFNKLWMDALTGIVYRDDSQIVKLTIERKYDKHWPRIDIEIGVVG